VVIFKVLIVYPMLTRFCVLYSLQTARMEDPVQRMVLEDSKPLVTTTEEGHILHFTLGTHPVLPSPDVPNIVNIASTTIPSIVATSQPVAIPYSGKCYRYCKIHVY